MKTPQEVHSILLEKFGEGFVTLNDNKLQEFMIDVKPEALYDVCMFLVSREDLCFDNCVLITALDDANGKKVSEPDGSFTFEGGTLSVIYHLESFHLHHKVVLRVVLPREEPKVASVAEIWKHADWEEREAYDMIGIEFINHPNLERILMPYDWEGGYPLRKDYKNPEFYQGMKIPY